MITEDILRIKEWYDANYLYLNIDKTKVLVFNFAIDKFMGRYHQFHIDTKFVGPHIENNLKFNKHKLNLIKKLSYSHTSFLRASQINILCTDRQSSNRFLYCKREL